MVVTRRPPFIAANVMHERIRLPSMRTVQAPHSPRSQPFLVPVSAKCSRNASSSVIRGSIVMRCVWPLTIIVTVMHSSVSGVMDASLMTSASRDVGRADALWSPLSLERESGGPPPVIASAAKQPRCPCAPLARLPRRCAPRNDNKNVSRFNDSGSWRESVANAFIDDAAQLLGQRDAVGKSVAIVVKADHGFPPYCRKQQRCPRLAAGSDRFR